MSVSAESRSIELTHDSYAYTWPVAVEQIAVLEFLRDSRSHGGQKTGYCECSLSHIILVGPHSYILRRPLKLGGDDCSTPEARWDWCERQRMEHQRACSPQVFETIPIVKRDKRLWFCGPGEIIDWVLKRTNTALH